MLSRRKRLVLWKWEALLTNWWWKLPTGGIWERWPPLWWLSKRYIAWRTVRSLRSWNGTGNPNAPRYRDRLREAHQAIGDAVSATRFLMVDVRTNPERAETQKALQDMHDALRRLATVRSANKWHP